MKRLSLDSRIKAVEAMISIVSGGTRAPTGDTRALLIEHARRAIAALVWLRDNPEAKALMQAQAEAAK